jgi:hypothetical protein
MKTKIKIISLLLMLCTGIWITPQKASAQGASVNFQVFYDDLSPYGTWVDNADYGYVWVPNVAPGFTPYSTNGYWVMTDEGWTWVSNYPWGWAPFHYGRWYTDPNYGPMWVPDNEWGPGWVTWRRSGDYYGWAPIGPGVSITMAYSDRYDVPSNQWTFVRDRDFGRRDINNYYVNHSNNATIIHNSRVINNPRVDRVRNITYNAGPERAEVEKHAGRKFNPIAIKESNKPGQTLGKTQLQIYRPQVQKNSPNGKRPAPSKVASLKEVKTPAQRTSGTPLQKGNQPVKQQQISPQRTVQPAKQQQSQPQRTVQPAKQQQPPQQQRTVQPVKQQQTPPQRNVQPAKQQQPPQQQRTVQPAKQQQTPPQRTVQPAKQQQQSQPQRTVQPAKQQQPPQQQRTVQPAKQQKSQPQRTAQPPKQQQSKPQQTNPPQKKEENPPH